MNIHRYTRTHTQRCDHTPSYERCIKMCDALTGPAATLPFRDCCDAECTGATLLLFSVICNAGEYDVHKCAHACVHVCTCQQRKAHTATCSGVNKMVFKSEIFSRNLSNFPLRFTVKSQLWMAKIWSSVSLSSCVTLHNRTNAKRHMHIT